MTRSINTETAVVEWPNQSLNLNSTDYSMYKGDCFKITFHKHYPASFTDLLQMCKFKKREKYLQRECFHFANMLHFVYTAVKKWNPST